MKNQEKKIELINQSVKTNNRNTDQDISNKKVKDPWIIFKNKTKTNHVKCEKNKINHNNTSGSSYPVDNYLGQNESDMTGHKLADTVEEKSGQDVLVVDVNGEGEGLNERHSLCTPNDHLLYPSSSSVLQLSDRFKCHRIRLH